MKIKCPSCHVSFNEQCPKCFKLKSDRLYVVCSKCKRLSPISKITEQLSMVDRDKRFFVSYTCEACSYEDTRLIGPGDRE